MASLSERRTAPFQGVGANSAHRSTRTSAERGVHPTQVSDTLQQAGLVPPARGSRPPPPRRPRGGSGVLHRSLECRAQGSEVSGCPAERPAPRRDPPPRGVAAPGAPRVGSRTRRFPGSGLERVETVGSVPPPPLVPAPDPCPWQRLRGPFRSLNQGTNGGLSRRRGRGSLGHRRPAWRSLRGAGPGSRH